MENHVAHLNTIKFRKSLKTDSGDWYQIVQELGRGGNAVTFLVMQTSGARPGLLYAMKVFYKIAEESRNIQFVQEIDFLKSCSHPSVMEVSDTGTFRARTDSGEFLYFPYVVAEYLPTTLNDIIREGRATFVEKVVFVIQLLSALDYIGSLEPPVIHRDIKPQNIFIKGQSCVLGDFGLMKRFDRDYEGDDSLFKATSLPGMPYYYRSPDLVAYAKGGYRLTPASDIFQLGLVAAHLFTGRNPCVRPRDIMDNVELEPLGSVPGKQSAGVAKLIERMLTLDPRQRPNARQLLDPWQGVFWEASQRSIDLEGWAL
jgi:serine/threonine-protein kinase